jgi:hypothetical protein
VREFVAISILSAGILLELKNIHLSWVFWVFFETRGWGKLPAIVWNQRRSVRLLKCHVWGKDVRWKSAELMFVVIPEVVSGGKTLTRAKTNNRR